MRYFPVARPARSSSSKKRSGDFRLALTLFGAAFVVGGLLRLATSEEVFEVASHDLTSGPTRAVADEPEPASKPPKDPADALDAAIVSMLADAL